MRIKTGDDVFHRPSGETWTVAIADEQRDEVQSCGWPPRCVKLSDCDLVKSCTDEYSLLLLHDLAGPHPDGGYERRENWARDQLAEIEKATL